MGSLRRRPVVVCAVVLAAGLAGGATAVAASALSVGLPGLKVTVPSTEVSVGGIHVTTPGVTATVPSVGLTTTTPAPKIEPETPVITPVPSGGGQKSGGGGGASGTGSSPSAAGSTPATTSRTATAAPDTSHPAPSSPTRVTGASSSPTRRKTVLRRAAGQPARRVHTVAASSTPAARTRAATVTRERRPAPAAPGHHDSGNPLAAVGGALSLPLPVPDWSKPIILLLLVAAIALALRWLVTARRAKRLEAQRAMMLGDLLAMQAALVPAVPGDISALGLSVAYRPADGVAAGGDFYDVFELGPGRVGLVLGDVCGHGREALERAALTRYTVRAYLQAGLVPRAALALAGEVLADTTSSEFATVVAAIYEPSVGRLTYASAGHPAPIVVGEAPPVPVGLCCSPPVGVGIPTGARQSVISVTASGAVCFYTDGLTEARCEDGLLGDERLTELLGGPGPPPSADELLRRVTEAAVRTPDDMAACVLVPRVSGPPGLRVEELEVDRETLEGEQCERFLTTCGVTELETAELLARAGIVLKGHTTAVLRVELSCDGVKASTAPGEAHDLGRHARSPAGGVVSPPVTPLHA